MRNTTWKRIGLMAVLTLLFFVRPTPDASARRMSPVSPSQGEPSFLYALQDDERCRQWVDSVMHTLSLKERIGQLFDLRPHAIEERLKLRRPIYEETASYGHVGRTPRTVTKTFHSRYQGDLTMEVELFTWEKLDQVDAIRKAFGL